MRKRISKRTYNKYTEKLPTFFKGNCFNKIINSIKFSKNVINTVIKSKTY